MPDQFPATWSAPAPPGGGDCGDHGHRHCDGHQDADRRDARTEHADDPAAQGPADHHVGRLSQGAGSPVQRLACRPAMRSARHSLHQVRAGRPCSRPALTWAWTAWPRSCWAPRVPSHGQTRGSMEPCGVQPRARPHTEPVTRHDGGLWCSVAGECEARLAGLPPRMTGMMEGIWMGTSAPSSVILASTPFGPTTVLPLASSRTISTRPHAREGCPRDAGRAGSSGNDAAGTSSSPHR